MPTIREHFRSIYNLYRAVFSKDKPVPAESGIEYRPKPQPKPEEQVGNSGNKYLPQTLIRLDREESKWTVRNAVEGVQIFGGIGSGKTSGSGKTLAMKYLSAGFGGLVLTVKPDEKKLWRRYCDAAGRSDDLVIIEPDGLYYFDFLTYESGADGGKATTNILQVLETVIRAGADKESSGGENRFWDTALRLLMSNVIDLCRIAYGTVSVQRMYDIVQSLPRNKASEGSAVSKSKEETAFQAATRLAVDNVLGKVKAWEDGQDASVIAQLKESPSYAETLYEHVPDARMLRLVERYFTATYAELAEKTRSIIDFSFTGFLAPLMQDPFYSLFCQTPSGANQEKAAANPELSMKGKIIVLNLPVKLHHRAGRDCQIMYKYIWQRAMEQRTVERDSLPVFLWADEAQHFLHEHDAEFQATARSSLIATVYLSQNLPNYYASMGGEKSEYRVTSFLGTLATKIFHSNGDVTTNAYASNLIGEILIEEMSTTESPSRPLDGSVSIHETYSPVVRSADFQQLLNGGEHNKGVVTAIVHFQGPVLKKGKVCTILRFRQESITEEP